MTNIKRSRGRPAKAVETDINSIINKIEEQQRKFSAKCANNLNDLLDVIFDVASGTTKAGIKDQVGAAKYCIEAAEKFLQDNKEGYSGTTSAQKDNTEQVNRPIISVVANK